MRQEYSREGFTPAALLIPVSVSPLEGGKDCPATALIDTGADISVLPSKLREELDLTLLGYTECSGAFDEESKTVPTYYVRMSVADVWIGEVEVILTSSPYVLLGRDILNSLLLIADGPKSVFELTNANTMNSGATRPVSPTGSS